MYIWFPNKIPEAFCRHNTPKGISRKVPSVNAIPPDINEQEFYTVSV